MTATVNDHPPNLRSRNAANNPVLFENKCSIIGRTESAPDPPGGIEIHIKGRIQGNGRHKTPQQIGALS